MTAFQLISAMVIQSIPMECVIDCGANPVPTDAKLQYIIQTKDGLKYEVSGLEVFKRADPGAVVDLIMSVASDNPDWIVRRGPGNTVIVSGTKNSPVKSVTFLSTGWMPEVRRRFAGASKE